MVSGCELKVGKERDAERVIRLPNSDCPLLSICTLLSLFTTTSHEHGQNMDSVQQTTTKRQHCSTTTAEKCCGPRLPQPFKDLVRLCSPSARIALMSSYIIVQDHLAFSWLPMDGAHSNSNAFSRGLYRRKCAATSPGASLNIKCMELRALNPSAG